MSICLSRYSHRFCVKYGKYFICQTVMQLTGFQHGFNQFEVTEFCCCKYQLSFCLCLHPFSFYKKLGTGNQNSNVNRCCVTEKFCVTQLPRFVEAILEILSYGMSPYKPLHELYGQRGTKEYLKKCRKIAGMFGKELNISQLYLFSKLRTQLTFNVSMYTQGSNGAHVGLRIYSMLEIQGWRLDMVQGSHIYQKQACLWLESLMDEFGL